MADVRENARVRSVLEDPSTKAIADVYATGFLNAAGDQSADRLEEFTSFVGDVLDANPEFRAILLSGVANRDEQLQIIDRVVGPHGSEFFANYLKVLVNHERLGLLPQILEATQLEFEKRNGQQRVQVVSASSLDDDALGRVREKIASAFSFDPIIENVTDPKLLGGLVIRVNNTVYDGSLRSRLNQLAKRMQQGSLHEIQSGRDRFSHPEGD
ncbi:MAG: ATP synthase F1 subunit delta [Planctomycetota bacterium]|jgi:F-type H+-transporting ATPase subunit delta